MATTDIDLPIVQHRNAFNMLASPLSNTMERIYQPLFIAERARADQMTLRTPSKTQPVQQNI